MQGGVLVFRFVDKDDPNMKVRIGSLSTTTPLSHPNDRLNKICALLCFVHHGCWRIHSTSFFLVSAERGTVSTGVDDPGLTDRRIYLLRNRDSNWATMDDGRLPRVVWGTF
jgi:hypothetical protein